MPEPDQHGRYRVRRKGDTSSPVWSTRNYNPDKHVIAPGPASDTYGAALPPKLHRTLKPAGVATPQNRPDADNPPAGDDTNHEETR